MQTTPPTLLALLVALAPLSAQAQPEPDAKPTIVPPKLTKFVEAEVPKEATEGLDEATKVEVKLALTISAEGRVTDVEVVDSGGPLFDYAALTAAAAFEFQPATVDGTPTAVQVPYTYVFEIEAKAPPPPPPPPAPPPAIVKTGSVEGRLRIRGERAPVRAETLLLIEQDVDEPRILQAISGEDGAFRIDEVPVGRWELSVEGGYERWSRTLRVEEGEVASVGLVYLQPKPVSPYGTVVVGEREKEAASRVSLSEAEIRTVPGTFGEPSRVVATLPGVARTPFGLPFYSVRGANLNQTGLLIDGFEVPLMYHLGAGPEVIHPELIGGVDFYPGGYPARYGRFAAGLIDLQTKDAPNDRWHLIVDVDLLKASVYFSIPFDEGRGVVTLAFRRSYYDLILPLFTDNTLVAYWDYQGRVSYQLSEASKLTVFLFGSQDDVESGPEDDEESIEDQEQSQLFSIMFHRLMVRLDHRIDGRSSLQWDTLLTFNSTVVESINPGSVDLLLDTGTFIGSMRLEYRHQLLEDKKKKTGLQLMAGLDLSAFYIDASVTAPGLDPIGEFPKPAADPVEFEDDIQLDQFVGALYAGLKWELGAGVVLLPSLRGDWFTYNSAHHFTLDPRLTVRYTPEGLDEALTVKAHVGLYHQAPQLQEIDERYGNPELPPLTAMQVALGTELRLDGGWEFDLTGFYNDMWDLPRPSDGAEVDLAAQEVTSENYVASGLGRSYGLELLLRKRVGDFAHGWLSYTLSRSERRDTQPEEDEGWEPFDLDQTHVLNLAWTFQLPYDWSIGVRFRLATGSPSARVVGAVYDADEDDFDPIVDGTERLPTYHQLDVRIDKLWRFDTWMFQVYVDVQNVYDADNSEGWDYQYDFRRRAQVEGIPILPTLGFRGMF